MSKKRSTGGSAAPKSTQRYMVALRPECEQQVLKLQALLEARSTRDGSNFIGRSFTAGEVVTWALCQALAEEIERARVVIRAEQLKASQAAGFAEKERP